MEQMAVTTTQASEIAKQAVQSEAASASQVTAAQIFGQLQKLSADNPDLSASQALEALQAQFPTATQAQSGSAGQVSPAQK